MSESNIPSVGVLGAGTWGLSLGCHLHKRGARTVIWDAFPDYLNGIAADRRHPKLPHLEIPADLELTENLSRAAECDMIAVVVASHAVRTVCEQLDDLKIDWNQGVMIVCSKGIEVETGLTLCDVAEETLGNRIRPRLGVLSGPSHAEEVSRELPTTVVAASESPETARKIQETFHAPRFRVYTHDDVLGVELGGSLKNVIAIASGICDGLGFGDNSRAALITRGLAEMSRLGIAMGADPETFAGLTGMGDLIVTAASRHSRNRNFGELIARGRTVEQAIEEIGMVVEGVKTTASAMLLAEQHRVDMPITRQTHRVLYEGQSPAQAVEELMSRDPKPEVDNRRE